MYSWLTALSHRTPATSLPARSLLPPLAFQSEHARLCDAAVSPAGNRRQKLPRHELNKSLPLAAEYSKHFTHIAA